MRIVTANELQHWLNGGQVLEKDARGPKVVRLEDGRFLKIFRSKRPLLARWRPEAQRFASNAQALQTRGVATPELLECLWIEPAKGVSACLYRPLAGTPLEDLFKQQRAKFDTLLPDFATYIHQLHRNGIYFRSLHLGNVLSLPEGDFGLIDFLDLRLKRCPLSRSLVKRNFAHLQSYLKRRRIESFPLEKLLASYEQASNRSSSS
ncbi:Toluene tolerance protein [Pseudomonas sp. 8Z]|uniref:toluene tolerance protein n=1 Tax=Pseudomonas sp. 8Z TaxID=2653166 RepID=UPI0012F10A89|nr:toluene tolerance protein [Pseudomonas sp. 8Z]VXC14929.1 Toluene tolerance protein [Pseudomonas sp. 8Z]